MCKNAQNIIIRCCLPTWVSQKKPEKDNNEKTYVAAISVSKQVLLMTCKVKVTSADGSSTIVRALIDPGTSASFIHERVTQHIHVRLPRSKKNERVEGVAGASTRTQGSVWSQVSGIEDNSGKFVVEA